MYENSMENIEILNALCELARDRNNKLECCVILLQQEIAIKYKHL